jgi:hypothetical protein
MAVAVAAGLPGDDAVELARSAGLELDGWQADVIRGAAALRADGKWANFEVGVNVPRQNGKGGILEARALAGLFLWGERYIIWSAHNFDTSKEGFQRLEDLIRETPELHGQVAKYTHSHGEEGITLRTGQRIRFRTRTKGGGKGFTADCVIFDEAMFLNESFHWALLPTLSARSMIANPQVWYTGSAADETIHDNAVVWARVRERGLSPEPGSLAYFEWSAHGPGVESPDDVSMEMAADPKVWRKANPALNIRISEEHVARELDALDMRGFAVERLGVGQWPRTDGLEETMIHPETWMALVDAESLLLNPVWLAFDVTPDRSKSAIAAAGYREDGLVHVEVIEHRRGTNWVVDKLAVLQDRHDPHVIVCDKFGPAGSLLAELENRDVRVEAVTASEHARCCGRLVDAVNEKRLRHLGSNELLQAIRGSRTRTLGDAWAWSRKTSAVDISPLVAATLAAGFALGEDDDDSAPVIF